MSDFDRPKPPGPQGATDLWASSFGLAKHGAKPGALSASSSMGSPQAAAKSVPAGSPPLKSSSRYVADWASFDLPGLHVVDRTTHALDIRDDEGNDLLLVIFRIAIPPGKTMKEVVIRRVSEEMTRLTGYEILENVEVEWAGAPAIEVASKWKHQTSMIYQRQAHVLLFGIDTCFALSGPMASRSACDAWIAGIRDSLAVRPAP